MYLGNRLNNLKSVIGKIGQIRKHSVWENMHRLTTLFLKVAKNDSY